MEESKDDSESQKAIVGESGAAINIRTGSEPSKFTLHHAILIGLEIFSICLLIYFALTANAHGH